MLYHHSESKTKGILKVCCHKILILSFFKFDLNVCDIFSYLGPLKIATRRLPICQIFRLAMRPKLTKSEPRKLYFGQQKPIWNVIHCIEFWALHTMLKLKAAWEKVEKFWKNFKSICFKTCTLIRPGMRKSIKCIFKLNLDCLFFSTCKVNEKNSIYVWLLFTL